MCVFSQGVDIRKYIYKNFVPLSVSIICGYALYLRIMVLYWHTLWADELLQLKLMDGTFLGLFFKDMPGSIPYFNGDYYLIYPFYKIFKFNKWGVAIPHIIATIVGFYLLYLICKRYFKSIEAYFITFGIVCFNATLIQHATEIRPYAVLPTLALATFYLLQKISDLNFKLNILWRISTIIFFVLVICFHVFGIFIFLSCFLFTLLSKYKENDFKIYFKNAIFFTGVLSLFVIPVYVCSYIVFKEHYIPGSLHMDTFEFIPNPFHDILGFSKGVFCNLVGFKKLYFLLLGVFIPFIFSYEDRYKQLLFLFFAIIMPISFILFSVLVQKYWFLQRQFIFVMPLFAFFIGWCIDSFIELAQQKMKFLEGKA